MHRSRTWPAMVVALGAAVAAPPALGAEGAKLSVERVSSPPAHAAPGQAYVLRGGVANRGGRAARTPLRVLLLRAGSRPRVAGTTSVRVRAASPLSAGLEFGDGRLQRAD